MSSDSDLSDYERVRLENIRRNNEFLAQLGLAPIKPKNVASIKTERVERPEKVNKKSKRENDVVVSDEKRRRSGRLSGSFVKVEAVQGVTESADDIADTVDETAFYDRTPHVRMRIIQMLYMSHSISYQQHACLSHFEQESDQLDDFEFQAFVELRKWRLLRSRELSIAPYGLFQNRTFCEMIRRRRNDATWATNLSLSDVASKATAEDAQEAEMNTVATITSPFKTSPRKAKIEAAKEPAVEPEQQQSLMSLPVIYDPALIDDLTECFGIAAGKTREGGYAWEALAVLNTHKVRNLLEQSRSLQPGLVV